MECKFDIDDLTDEKLEELIDTLWNVNKNGFVQKIKSKSN